MSDPKLADEAQGRLQHEDAYAKLREAIVTCQMEPGSTVTEGELAQSFGFGKAAVRVALVRLLQEGLVRSLGRRGYEVTPITIGDVEELFEVQAMLEGEAARRAVGRIDVERLAALETQLRAHEHQHHDANEKADINGVHAHLHLQIAMASGNQRLLAMVQASMRETSRLLYLGLGLMPEGQLDHSPIIQALRDHDPQAAETAARAHVEAGRDMVMRALLQSPAMRHIALPGRRIA